MKSLQIFSKAWDTYKASIFGVFDDVGFFSNFHFFEISREKNPGCEKKVQGLNQT